MMAPSIRPAWERCLAVALAVALAIAIVVGVALGLWLYAGVAVAPAG